MMDETHVSGTVPLWALEHKAVGHPRMCQNETITVNLRSEGKEKTGFEGSVSSCGHRVTTRSGGTRHCNGTNNDQYPCAGPTCTTALDDANNSAQFGFDG
ncbi:hypothetical protein F5148DRAFT_597316 [Russula earlei]|uniref:Uncharacterized protein n=1 Tax=Russula earlei TaxID=71964 RepID=A0ACC0TWB4_9AGAM|nr:hypothetical protein F5148DRAFT_597316 [Russula earlei]